MASADKVLLQSGLVREADFAGGALEASIGVVVALGDGFFDRLDCNFLFFFNCAWSLFWQLSSDL